LTKQCHELLHIYGWEVRVSHCYREANRATDALATMGVDDPRFLVILNSPVDGLSTIPLEEALGMARPRLVY